MNQIFVVVLSQFNQVDVKINLYSVGNHVGSHLHIHSTSKDYTTYGRLREIGANCSAPSLERIQMLDC